MGTGGDGEGIRPVIGIDFGTTNSCVSYIDALGRVRSVSVATSNAPYDRVLPSVVLNPLADRDAGETPLIGQAAQAEYGLQGRDGCYLEYFKHRLDEQRLRHTVMVKIEKNTGEYDAVAQGTKTETTTEYIEVGGQFSRDELVGGVAAIVEHLLQAAVSDGADPGSEVLLGVPVSYSGYARKRLICALGRARTSDGGRFFSGYADVLRRTRFVLEPVAVASAPGEDLEVDGTENVLVFDHGGGTLDLSIVRYESRPGFDRPVPVRELGAGGSEEVAGRHLDQAFYRLLSEDPTSAAALNQSVLDERLTREVIEEAKIALSTSDSFKVRFADLEVERAQFEAAIRPKLDLIRTTISDTVRRARLQVDDIDWVVMTGGSSLVPAVQQTVADVFERLESEDRILRYFPDDDEGVESAITDVAEGLARYGEQREFQQIVLWDVELGREEAGGFIRLFDQGTPYSMHDGRPELEIEVEAPDIGRPGCSFGIYEHQLDRQFSFGLAEVPRLGAGSRLRVKVRRDSLFPVMAVIDSEGNVVNREEAVTRSTQDVHAAADIEAYEAGALEDFFEQDAEYVPSVRPEDFLHAPLVRRLRIGDYVEWSAIVGKEGLKTKRGSGKLIEINRIGYGEVPEMSSWDVSDYRFCARTKNGTMTFETRNGCLRLAPKPAVSGNGALS